MNGVLQTYEHANIASVFLGTYAMFTYSYIHNSKQFYILRKTSIEEK